MNEEYFESMLQDPINPVKNVIKGKFVGIEAYKQIMWERDTAISYLKRAGVSLGENVNVIRTDVVEDVIKRRKSIFHGGRNYDAGYRQACDDIYLGIANRTGGEQE